MSEASVNTHDLGMQGRVLSALHIVGAVGNGHCTVNTGFIYGLVQDLLEATPDALEALRRDEQVVATLALVRAADEAQKLILAPKAPDPAKKKVRR